MDSGGRMLGMGPLSEIIAQMSGEPLGAIRDALLARASAHGPQEDDQSVILIRML